MKRLESNTCEAGPAERGRQRDVLRPQPDPGPQHHLAGGDILAGKADVGARMLSRRQHDAASVVDPHVLLHEDGVGPGGQRRAGENPRGMARRELRQRRGPGGDAAAERQRTLRRGGQIGAGDRVTVHRRIGEQRQRQRRDQIGRENAAVRPPQRHGLDALDDADPRGDQRHRLVHRQHRRAGGKAIVRQLGHRFAFQSSIGSRMDGKPPPFASRGQQLQT